MPAKRRAAAAQRWDAALVLPMAVSGLGLTFAAPAVTKAVVSLVAPQDVGRASGTFSTLRQLGGAFAIIGAVFAASGSYSSGAAFSHGYRPAIAVAALLAFVGMLAALAIPARRHQDLEPVLNGRITECRPVESPST